MQTIKKYILSCCFKTTLYGGADGTRTSPAVRENAGSCAKPHSCVESDPTKTTQQHDLAPWRTPVLEPYWNFTAHSWIEAIDAYKEVSGDWLACPNCRLQPRVWEFDNGRRTACGCWTTKYNHFSVCAESICSHYKRSAVPDYDADELRKNWNHWCKTGEELFKHASERDDGRW